MSNLSILNNLPKRLAQPNSIAIAVSFALHALVLGLALPSLDFGKLNNTPIFSKVPIIKFNTEEEARLPNLANSLSNLPTINKNTPDTPQTESIALPPPPPSLFKNEIPSLSSIFPNLESIPLPPPPNQFPTPPPPLPPTTQGGSNQSGKIPPAPTNGDVEIIRGSFPPTFQSPNNSSNNNRSNNPNQNQDPNAPKWQIATAQNDLSLRQSLIKRQQALVASIAEIGRSLRQDRKNTSESEVKRNYDKWIEKVKQQNPQNLNLNKAKIEGTYPKDACLRKIEGTSTYGIMVDRQGRVRERDVQLIKSSGYLIFNQQATKDIIARTFTNKTGKPIPYEVNVEFNYTNKICPSLAISGTGTPTKNQQPTSSQQKTPITPSESPQKPESSSENQEETPQSDHQKPQSSSEENPNNDRQPEKTPQSNDETPNHNRELDKPIQSNTETRDNNRSTEKKRQVTPEKPYQPLKPLVPRNAPLLPLNKPIN